MQPFVHVETVARHADLPPLANFVGTANVQRIVEIGVVKNDGPAHCRPNSIDTFFIVAAASRIICWPTRVDPVSDTFRTAFAAMIGA